MSTLPDPPDVLSCLRELAEQFSGRRNIREEDLIFSDLGINGQDFIDFVEEVERQFGVDLNDVSPRGAGGSGKDVSLSGLCSLIVEQQHRG
jgi:acyl carrier protein